MKDKFIHGIMLGLIYFMILIIVGCDMSQKEIIKSNLPSNCKFTLLCWKKFEKTDKSSCEKFAIPCVEDLKRWDPKGK
jgi:hypothetical protein